MKMVLIDAGVVDFRPTSLLPLSELDLPSRLQNPGIPRQPPGKRVLRLHTIRECAR